MTTKKAIEAAWKVHDTTEPTCETDKDHWNKSLGHSHYNMACRRWVNKYLLEHPVQESVTTTDRPKTEKVKCAGCKKRLKPTMMRSQFESGEYACSARCEMRITREHDEKIAEEERKKKTAAEFNVKVG